MKLQRRTFFSIVLVLALALGGLLKYTNIIVLNSSNEITSIGVKKVNAWYSAYQYRKQIVLDEALITGTTVLTNFPVLISMTDTSLRTTGNGGRVTNANGYDIVFTTSGDVALDHEIESYNATTGEINMWVEIPSLSYNSDTTIYMYYGNGSISTSQENKTGVWNSSFKGVWHMNDGSSSTIADSTSYADTFTKKTTTEPASATGKIAGGQNWDGTDDYASMADNANISPTTASNTFSGWFFIDTFGVATSYIKNVFGDESGAFSTLWRLGSQGSATYAQRLGINYNDASNHDNQNNTNLTASTWTHIAVTTDGTNARWYINGALDTTAAYTFTPQSISATWYMGSYGTTARRYDGIIDEMRMYHGTLSGDWIQAEFANQNNTGVGAGKFMQSVGSEEPVATPTPSPTPTPSTTVPILSLTPSQTGMTNTVITLGGDVTSNGGAALSARGVCYSLTSNDSSPGFTTAGGSTPESNVTCTNEGQIITGIFTIPQVTGLTPSLTYSFRSFARNSVGNGYSNVGSFKTYGPPSTTTSAASSLATNSAILNSTINPNGASTNISYLWGTTSGIACNVQPNTLAGPSALTGTADLSGATTQATLGSLLPNTPYYYCVMATNTYGTTYGTVTSVTTNPTPGAYSMMPAGSSLGSPDCDDAIASKPCAPLNLTPSTISGSQINFTWSANGIPAPSTYTLYWCNRTTVPGCDAVTNTIGNSGAQAGTSYSNTGLTSASTYAYKLKATNASGDSEYALTTGTTSTCVNGYQDVDGDGVGAGAFGCYAGAVGSNSDCLPNDNTKWVSSTIYPDTDGTNGGSSGTISRGAVTKTTTDSQTSITVTKPADVVSGEFMFATVGFSSQESHNSSLVTVTPPSGWTAIGGSSGSNSEGMYMYYKWATGSEPANYTWSFTLTSNSSTETSDANAWITTYNNVDTTSPIHASATTSQQGSNTSQTAPSVTTSVANTMIVSGIHSVNGDDYYTEPSGTNLYLNPKLNGGDSSVAFDAIKSSSSGGSGTKTSIHTTSTGWASMTVALTPKASLANQCVGSSPPSNYSFSGGDCEDNSSSYYQNLTAYLDGDDDGVRGSSSSQVCSGASLRTGFNASSGTDCAPTDGSKWQNLTGYSDNDQDSYTVGGSQQACSGSTLAPGYLSSASGTADCYDKNSLAAPCTDVEPYGICPSYTSTRGTVGQGNDYAGNTWNSYDYNCDGSSVASQGFWQCSGSLSSYNNCTGDPYASCYLVATSYYPSVNAYVAPPCGGVMCGTESQQIQNFTTCSALWNEQYQYDYCGGNISSSTYGYPSSPTTCR